MGIFGKIKSRIMGRREDDDIEDIRSYVTGDDRYAQDFQSLAPKGAEEAPPAKPWEREQLPARENDFSLDDRRDLSLGEQGQGYGRSAVSKDYDIMDKLSIIESQLAAIRSQTETINERLKNLELKMNGGMRRY